MVAFAPPWPRRSVPAACMVALCAASSMVSISSLPTYAAAVGPILTRKLPL